MKVMAPIKVAAAGLVLGGAAGRAAHAQSVWTDPGGVRGGRYVVEPDHTQVVFAASHFGLTTFYGVFSRVSGTLFLDPKNPSASTLSVSVPVLSVSTTSAKLDGL
jgi:polyisoprenoid-binding protein YceI